MKTLLIYGSGGQGKEIVDLARYIDKRNERWNDVCFIDDFAGGAFAYNCRVMDFEKARELQSQKETECIIALGEPALRRKLFDKCRQAGLKTASLISPAAIVSDTAVIGEGVIVSHNVFVSSNCRIENNVLLQPMCSVAHDSVIGEHSVISTFAAIAGNCTVGAGSYIGLSAAVREKVTIGGGSILGMGAIAVNDIPDAVIAVGVPARPVRSNENKKVFK